MAHIRKTFLKRSQTTVVWNPQLHFPGKYCLWASSVVLCNVSQMKCQGGNVFEDCWRFPVAKLCPTLCDPMVCSTCPSPTPGVTQTHVHWVSDAIQPYHSLLSPSPALNLSQHQGLFQWVGSLHQVARVLELQLQHHTGIAYWEKVNASFFSSEFQCGSWLCHTCSYIWSLNSHWWHSVTPLGSPLTSFGHTSLISNGQCLHLIRRLLLGCPGKVSPEVSGNYFFVLPHIL